MAGRRDRGPLVPEDRDGSLLDPPAAAVALLGRPAHHRVPHRPRVRSAASCPTSSRSPTTTRTPVRSRSSGRTGRRAATTVASSTTRSASSTRRRSWSCGAAGMTSCGRGACSSGSTRTSRSCGATSRATRRSSAPCRSARPVTVGRGGPRLEPGGRFGATLAAYDRRLAAARVTLRATSDTNGFVNGLPMLHHRYLARIEGDGTDTFAELVTMRGRDVEVSGAWAGDAELELFDSPVEELDVPRTARDARRLLEERGDDLRGRDDARPGLTAPTAPTTPTAPTAAWRHRAAKVSCRIRPGRSTKRCTSPPAPKES